MADTSLGFNLIGRDVSASDALEKIARKAKATGDDFDVVGKNISGFNSTLTKGFLGVGAALGGAFAIGNVVSSTVDYLRDAATAAMEDEKSMVALATAMDNVGLAAKNAGTEDFIKSLMLATGVADDQLRPAMQRLVTATGDAEQSQRLLTLALDIATATGKDATTVATALGKAANGNVAALTRLGVPLDANIVKTRDFGAAVDVLSEKFGGQAAAAADTYGGQMQRIQTAAAEAQETIGYALLDAVNNAAEAFGGTDGIVGAVTAAGDSMAGFVTEVGLVTTEVANLISQVSTLNGVLDEGGGYFDTVRGIFEDMFPQLTSVGLGFDYLGAKANVAAASQQMMADSIDASEALYAGYIASLDESAVSTRGLDIAAQDAADALDEMKSSFDAVNGAMSTQDAVDRYKESLLGLKGAVDANSRSLDDNNLAGLKNRDVIRGVFADAQAAAQAWGQANGRTTEEVQAKFATMTANVRDRLINQGFKPEEVDTFLGGLGLWNGQISALASGITEGQGAAAMRLMGQALAARTASGFDEEMGPGGKANAAMSARMTALAKSLERETTITVTTVNRSVYESQVPAAARRASGGPVDAGMPYVIGERGPELFVPGASGSIVPNGSLSALPRSGGVTIPVVINVSGTVVQEQDLVTTVRDGLAQMMRRRGLDPAVIGA